MEIKLIYGITAIISLLMIVGYCKLIRKRDLWFILLYVSVFVVNAGYFMLSVSESLNGALFANRVAYLGSVFLPLCMLMIITDVCGINRHKWTTAGLIGISVTMFVVAASGGYTDWYYDNVSLIFINGAAKLVKSYGTLHALYYIYLLAYFMTMVIVIIYAHVKKNAFDFKHAILLLCVVLGNIGIWFIEQRINVDFEFLSVSYIITELFLLFLYGLLQDHGIIGKEHKNAEKEYDLAIIMNENPDIKVLTAREREVLKFILQDKKRKEIADELGVTEHTIKKHTAHIFSKMDVCSRKELYKKLKFRL